MTRAARQIGIALMLCLLGTGVSAENPKLSGPMVAGGRVLDFEIAPDGHSVVYRADQEVDDRIELWSVPIDGSTPAVKLNGPLAAGEGVNFPRISPDGAWVTYKAGPWLPADVLYSVPLDGSLPPTQLSTEFSDCSLTGVPCNPADGCPDAGNCMIGGEVCESDLDCPGVLNPCANYTAQTCDRSDLLSGGQFTPDSSRVVYLHAQPVVPGGVFNGYELYTVAVDGSEAPVRLNDPLPDGTEVMQAKIVAHGSRVVYQTRQGIAPRELYSVPIDRSEAPVKISGELASGDYIRSWKRTSDGTRIIYVADQEAPALAEIYVVPMDGSAPPIKISGNQPYLMGLPPFGVGFLLSHDDTRVIYTNNDEELISAPIDGSAPPVVLNPPLGQTLSIRNAWASPDRPWVAFSLCLSGYECSINVAPVDGGAPAVEVVPTTPGMFVASIFSRADRVGWSWDPQADPAPPFQTFSVPVDGSQPPTMLSGDLRYRRLGSTLIPFATITDDLRVVPITGSLPPVKVNGAQLIGQFSEFALNVDETWAVFEAEETGNFDELFSSRLDLDADGVPDDTDNCPRIPNADQGPAVFGQTVLASSKTELSWPTTADDVLWVRGPLGSIDSYTTDDSGALADALSLADETEPAAGEALYYLFKPGGDCAVASWQSSPLAEPARDAVLP